MHNTLKGSIMGLKEKILENWKGQESIRTIAKKLNSTDKNTIRVIFKRLVDSGEIEEISGRDKDNFKLYVQTVNPIKKIISSLSPKIQGQLQKLESKINLIQKRVEHLENAKIPKTQHDFEILTPEAWEQVERNLSKAGIILEFQMAEKLQKISENTNVAYDSSEKFEYPNVPGGYYIDLLCKNYILLGEDLAKDLNNSKDVITTFWNGERFRPEISSNEFEIDYFVEDNLKFDVGKYRVEIVYKYAIECKSREDPPVNYLIITEPHSPHRIYPINFPKSFWFSVNTNHLPVTFRLPIVISSPHWNVEANSRWKEAFWELFRYIDYESSLNAEMWLDWDTPNPPQKIKTNPNDSEEIFRDFSNIFNNLNSNKEIPNPLEIKIFLYTPIIVVNGNIYEIPFIRGTQRPLFERKTNIPGFITKISHKILGDSSPRSYHHLWNAIACQLQQIGISSQDPNDSNKKQLINLDNPELMVLTMSSENFETTFNELISEFREQVKETCINYLNDLNNKRSEDIFKQQVFFWYIRNQGLGNRLIFQSLMEYLKLRSNLPTKLRGVQ